MTGKHNANNKTNDRSDRYRLEERIGYSAGRSWVPSISGSSSLLSTCRLQGVDPYDYLIYVLQRVATRPAKDVAQLTPRLWKEHFSATPLRSPLVCFILPAKVK